MIIAQQSVLTLECDDRLSAVCFTDPKTRNHVFYKCERMSVEEISQLLNLMEEESQMNVRGVAGEDIESGEIIYKEKDGHWYHQK